MRRWFLALVIGGMGTVPVLAKDPFNISFSQEGQGTNLRIIVAVSIPPSHHIYADQIQVELDDGRPLPLIGGDRAVKVRDALSATDLLAYTNNVSLVYSVGLNRSPSSILKFTYQGCNEQECLFPQTRTYVIQTPGEASRLASPGGASIPGEWSRSVLSPQIVARAAGYLKSSEFEIFLDRAEGRAVGMSAASASVTGRIGGGFLKFGVDPVGFLKAHGAWWTVLVILIGGFFLNLTPCVLPMIPINLAILGVGAQNSSRARGLLLGSAYGVGMALVYGVLGLVVVLTGSQFGTLNSMPWFNAIIGLVFIALSLAMFDVFSLDFSRFQSSRMNGAGVERGGVATAFVMGGVMALLAGACVAPVVIAVLLLSSNLYGHGAGIGLALPFILGVGMALPWPLAGAGLAFLPKPGAWMAKVKYGFGVVILLFAVYYFFLAYRGWWGQTPTRQTQPGVYELSASDSGKWAAVLNESVKTGKPVLVDFWATWCKNCEAMELTTFRDAAIRKRLANYLVVKFQMEQLSDPATRQVADSFEVKGLPTYLVLKPQRGTSAEGNNPQR